MNKFDVDLNMDNLVNPPKGQRKVRMFMLTVFAMITIVYGWLFSGREGDATAIILTAISLLCGGNAWLNQVNATVHKSEDQTQTKPKE